jgi:hypothetical protein
MQHSLQKISIMEGSVGTNQKRRKSGMHLVCSIYKSMKIMKPTMIQTSVSTKHKGR